MTPAAALEQAIARHQAGDFAAAAVLYEDILAAEPHHPDALHLLGVIAAQAGDFTRAQGLIETAIAQRPGDPAFHSNLAATLRGLKSPDAALAAVDRALALKSDYADALVHRAGILLDLGRSMEAAACYAYLTEIASDFPFALGLVQRTLIDVCEWSRQAANAKRLVAEVRAGKAAVVPFTFLAATDNAADQLTCAATYVACRHGQPRQSLWRGEPYSHDRLRLAYVSADLTDHAIGCLTAGLFERHDRARFEVTAISLAPPGTSPQRERLRAGFDAFIEAAALTDLEIAQRLRAVEIDIAIDMGGYTGHDRLGIFAHRPAPVQASWLGYPGTLAVPFIDYLITDAHIVPPTAQAHYTEAVVRLPDTYQVNDRQRVIAEHTPSRADLGLPKEGFVFCAFNSAYKLTPAMFDVWMRLLGQTPGSVLWLLIDAPIVGRNLRREAQGRGIAPERIVFGDRLAVGDHLARHRLADLYLDTAPVGAHTTAADALWAGLPVLTWSGGAFAARVAGSLLKAAGLPELVTETLADYEALALRLTREPGLLAGLRARLAANRETCALFDTDRFRRHLEAAYQTMHQRRRLGMDPQSFSVEALA